MLRQYHIPYEIRKRIRVYMLFQNSDLELRYTFETSLVIAVLHKTFICSFCSMSISSVFPSLLFCQKIIYWTYHVMLHDKKPVYSQLEYYITCQFKCFSRLFSKHCLFVVVYVIHHYDKSCNKLITITSPPYQDLLRVIFEIISNTLRIKSFDISNERIFHRAKAFPHSYKWASNGINYMMDAHIDKI